MSKLTCRQIKLQKAEEKLNKVSKRSKQFHLRFDRVQKGKRYKTTVRIERGDKNYSGNNHGLLHRTVNLKHRVIGDVPSVTKAIDSIQPETVKGKIAKGTAKAVNTAGHAAVHTAVNTGLAAETLTLNTADAVRNEVTHKLRQKYTQEAVDDGHRGTIAAARIAFDAVNGTRRHLTLKRQNRVAVSVLTIFPKKLLYAGVLHLNYLKTLTMHINIMISLSRNHYQALFVYEQLF